MLNLIKLFIVYPVHSHMKCFVLIVLICFLFLNFVYKDILLFGVPYV